MYFLAVATDYDGTIAHHGSVKAETIAALKSAGSHDLSLQSRSQLTHLSRDSGLRATA